MILVGLDTIVTGNIDCLIDLSMDGLYLPSDPNKPKKACNGVVVSSPMRWVYESHRGENDMDWLNTFSHKRLDDTLVKSFKCHVKKGGIGDARIVYFHGREKPHEIEHEILEHWI